MNKKAIPPANNTTSGSLRTGLLYKGWMILFMTAGTFFISRTAMDIANAPRLAAVSVMLVVGVWVLSASSTDKKTSFGLPDIAISAFATWQLISLLWAKNRMDALFDIEKTFFLALSFYVGKHFYKTEAVKVFWYKLMAIITATALIYLLYTIIQWYISPKNLYNDVYEITGFSSHKNLVSGLFFFFIILDLAALQILEGRWKTLLKATITGCLLLILFLQTRSIYLALIASILFFILCNFNTVKTHLHHYWKGWIAALVVGIGVLVAAVFFTGTSNTFWDKINITSYTKSRSGRERLLIWEKSLPMIASHPLLGVGAGNWKFFLPKDGISGLERAEKHFVVFVRPHNDFLWILCETGLIGLLLWLFFLGILFRNGLRSRFSTDPVKKNTVFILLSGLLGYLLFSGLDFPKERIEHTMYLGLLMALLLSYTRTAVDYKVELPIPSLLKNIVLCGIALVTAITAGYRWNGEKYASKAILYNNRQDWNNLISAATAGMNPFYSMDPMSNPLLWYRGIANFNAGQKDKAEADLEKAVAITPYHHKILFSYGQVLYANNKAEKAIAIYDEVLRINPAHEDVKVQLAKHYLQKSELAKAREYVIALPDENKAKEQLNSLLNNQPLPSK